VKVSKTVKIVILSVAIVANCALLATTYFAGYKKGLYTEWQCEKVYYHEVTLPGGGIARHLNYKD
jgi:hypothetical protein